MEVILGKTAGFCPGITNAIKKAKRILNDNDNVFCLGELVHNKHVVKYLEKKGMKVIHNIVDVPKDSKLIIRAHGITKDIYEKIKLKNIELFDLTCPKVLKIHKQAEEYSKDNSYIIFIAEKEHPETIGTYSFCTENSIIVEERLDIENAIEEIKNKDIKNIIVISQTTFSIEKFDKYVSIIKKKLPEECNLIINKTICDATRLRQEETTQIAKQVELMIVIGGKKSSNTNKLYDIAIQECNNAMLVETLDDLFMNYVKRFKKVGIMAGASTPKEIIDKVVEIVENTNTEGYIYECSK